MANEKILEYVTEATNPDPKVDKMDISTVAGGDESKFAFINTVLNTRLPFAGARHYKGPTGITDIADEEGDWRIRANGSGNLVVEFRNAATWEEVYIFPKP